jgi:hypothetical protein
MSKKPSEIRRGEQNPPEADKFGHIHHVDNFDTFFGFFN